MPLPKKNIEQIFEGVYSGEIDINNLPVMLSEFTYDELMKFVKDGFGKLSTEAKQLKFDFYDRNITAFSGAKNFQEVKDLNRLVFLEDGSKRPFKEFREFAQSIDDEYNINWLKTEQDTAFVVSQSADQWTNFEDDKEELPLLEYQTVGDQRVRDEHADWDGIVRPVDDSFWDTNMPPNGFNCRCQVIQKSEGKQSDLRDVRKNDDPMFDVNPGKVDYIFDEQKHPYFQHARSESREFQKAITWH